jgi:hypothetical protein
LSIEQLPAFHMVRRILKAVAPDFRLLANPQLEPGVSALDVSQKTVEISEDTEIFQAVAALLFQIGHLVLLKDQKYDLLFGRGFSSWVGSEGALVDRLSDLGVDADIFASNWALMVLISYWPLSDKKAKQLLSPYAWHKKDWTQYFNNK